MGILRQRKPARRRPARKRRREHLLEVTATAETERRRRNQKIFLYAAEAVLLVGLVAFTWFGIRALVNILILENDQYRVRVVEVNTDGVMSREEALEKTGLREGLNIFSLNLDSAQRALASIPEIKEARVERILPDTVTIAIEARRPVAWVAPRDTGVDPSAMETASLVDKDGVMMKPSGPDSSVTRLPVVYGVPTEQWRLGDRIDLPELQAALELFSRAGERTNPEIPLRAADITKGWCVVAWGDPQTRYTFGLEEIPAQLDRLQMVLLHVGQTSRKIATANLMPERNTPVTFQDDPPPAAEPVVRKAQAVKR
jgi:cell division septal protein FtsQ